MTTTITAEALHAIYNGPHVAPDGTPRRGLWDRCAETAPNALLTYDCDVGRVWGQPQANGDVWSDQDVVANAALCRVAVEDWLAKQSCGVHILDHTSGTAYDGDDDNLFTAACIVTWVGGGSLGLSGLAVEWRDDGSVAECMFTDVTIHHALVAAAHAVLDAKGVHA